MKAQFTKNWLIVIFWLLVTLLMTGQDVLFGTLRNQPLHWADLLIFKVKWLLYIPFTFLVFWLGEKIPIRSPRLLKNLFIHLAISLIISFLSIVLFSVIITILWQLFIGQKAFLDIFKRNLAVSLLNEFVNYWLLLAAHKGFVVFQDFQRTQLEKAHLEKQLSDAKLGFLKMQLQPHFLFNTHHTIIGLMQKGDTEKATKMLIKLSDLLRLSLKENMQDLVPLQHEIRLLELYLDILKIRFEEKLGYNILVINELQKFYVPPMLLQPIVENAIKYGIEPFAKKGFIEIKAEQIDEKLCLSVSDNGVENVDLNFNFGVGLSNIQARLQNLFGQNFDLIIAPNSPENGITVKVIIPILQTAW